MQISRKWRRRLFYLTGAFFLAVFTLALTEGFVYLSSLMVRSPLQGVENQLTDLAFQARLSNKRHQRVTVDDVCIIDIDDESIKRLGRPQLWPRAYDAFAINYVTSGQPKAIGIDYLYTESDSLLPSYAYMLELQGFENAQGIIDALSTDHMLSEAIATAGNVYLSCYDDDTAPDSLRDVWDESGVSILRLTDTADVSFQRLNHPVAPIPMLQSPARAVGSISMPSEGDGTVRFYPALLQMPDSSGFVGNFPFYMALDQCTTENHALSIQDRKLHYCDTAFIPLFRDGTFRINWLGKEDQIRYISFYKVLDEFIPAEYFQDKFVFFGTSASGLQDLKTVPSTDTKMPGVEVHVVAFLNMMNGAFMHEMSERQALPWFMLASLLLTMLFLAVKPLLGFLLSVVLVIAEMFLFSLWFIPEYSIVFPIVSLMIITFFAYLNASLFTYFIRERKSRQLKTAFGTYLSPEVVEQIIKNPDLLQLGGQKKNLTVLFSDIRGFTTYTEALDPQKIVSMLNDYLSTMSEVIFKHKGTIDKFIGDAIMAVFGAPIDQEDHPARACRVALDMIDSMVDVNHELGAKGFQPLKIGIGINTGEMTVGNIGSERRFDYTVIGDAVNLGSRLEGITKFFGVEVIVSEQTFASVSKDEFLFRELGGVIVKGKNESIEVYQLVGRKSQKTEWTAWLEAWEDAFHLLKLGEITKALWAFEKCRAIRDDEATRFYLNKCHHFESHPEDFSLVIEMDSK
jgi:adenylate cyclase